MSGIIISQGSFNCPVEETSPEIVECAELITIIPMDVFCSSTGATTTQTRDGVVSLTISGGTEPYNIIWSNGYNGITQTVGVGIYDFTVTDYYGDFTITGSCEVVSLLTPTPTMTPTMTPTPSSDSIITQYLCLFNNNFSYTFEYYQVDENGYHTWINYDNNMFIYFNVRTNRWEVSNWVGQGEMVMMNSQNLLIPVGNTWFNMNKSWTVSEGECAVDELTLTTIPNNENCIGSGDGTVLLNADGGEGNYCYRIQGVSPYPLYQSNNLFTNLSVGTYIAEVIDNCENCNECVDGNIATNEFTIGSGVGNEYAVSIIGVTVFESLDTKTVNYNIQINPQLPEGITVTFDMFLLYEKFFNSPENTAGYIEPNFNFVDTNFNNITFNEAIVSDSECEGIDENLIADSVDSIPVTFDSTNSNITGQFSHSINPFFYQWANCDCPALAQSDVTIDITNLRINDPNGCSTVNKQGRIVSYISLNNCMNVST